MEEELKQIQIEQEHKQQLEQERPRLEQRRLLQELYHGRVMTTRMPKSSMMIVGECYT